MLNKKKNFIHINEEFTCNNCKQHNPKSKGSCRNHCKYCLYSLHVDEEIPGDRLSNCKELMKPVSIDQNGKKGFKIIHKCTKCEKKISNKVSLDDNFDEIIKISAHQNLHYE